MVGAEYATIEESFIPPCGVVAMVVSIRPEEPGDVAAIRRVLEAAFPTAAEARLVELLRAGGHLRVSLVAEVDGDVAGHVAFSPIQVDGDSRGGVGVGLAPLAVLPDFQRQGIGSRLVHAGIAACRRAGYGFILVLGWPAFYPRFGFTRADEWGLGNEYGAGESFLVLELRDGAIPKPGGTVRYGPEFAEFTV
jgi:putative acetyltransferase